MDGRMNRWMDGCGWVGGWFVHSVKEEENRFETVLIKRMQRRNKVGVCVLVAMRIKQNDKLYQNAQRMLMIHAQV